MSLRGLIRSSAAALVFAAPLLWTSPLRSPDGPWRGVSQDSSQETGPIILVAHVDDDVITPVTSGYVSRAIRGALETGAVCLVIQLDTPGGLLESTRTIVRDFLASPVPIVVYVAPSGARAASAGVFITIASHIAAMAPATHIGAAHPVQLGPSPGQAPDQSQEPDASEDATMEEKLVNDTVAWIRTLAELRGRNVEWAERSVVESESIPSSEALELNVIDLVAEDLDELLALIDGRTVDLPSGTTTLTTAGATVVHFEMWWGEELLSVISNPNIAFILLMLGFYGLLFEFYSPGWGISGTLGAICIVLAFFGLAVLPINIAGLALILLAIGLFVAEVFFTSFGILTVGGAACLILGGIMLIDTPLPVMRISLSILIPVAVATALVAFFLLSRVVTSMGTRVRTGSEGLVDETGIASEPFRPDGAYFVGQIRVHGEIWKARSTEPVETGERVRIDSRDDLTLNVRKPG